MIIYDKLRAPRRVSFQDFVAKVRKRLVQPLLELESHGIWRRIAALKHLAELPALIFSQATASCEGLSPWKYHFDSKAR